MRGTSPARVGKEASSATSLTASTSGTSSTTSMCASSCTTAPAADTLCDALDSDDEFEAALFSQMDAADGESSAMNHKLTSSQDEEIAFALQTEEFNRQSPKRMVMSTPGGPCLLLLLPDELLRRCFRFVTVASLLTSVRLVNKRCAVTATSVVRERTCTSIFDALVAGFETTPVEQPAEVQSPRLLVLSRAVEASLVTFLGSLAAGRGGANLHRTLASKCRSLCFNLSDRKNPELRLRLLRGTLEPSLLVRMSAQEMASAGLQQQRSEWHRKSLACAIKPDRQMGFATDLYRCDGCGSQSSRIHRVIRPGRAVDRARTYATCTRCHARWEV